MNTLVRMTHPTRGELLVPPGKVDAYRDDGWKIKRNRKQPTEPPDTGGSPVEEGE